MFGKLKAFYCLFQAGQMVSNPAAWKTGQMTAGLIAAFLGAALAIAKAFGYDIPLSDGDLVQIGGVVLTIFGLFNGAVTVTTTDKIGLQPTISKTADEKSNDYIG